MVKIMRRLSLTGGTKEPARSKAVDDLLHTDLDLDVDLANSSMRSFASSITSPPSQSGSFYHRVQKQNEENEMERKYGYNDTNLSGDLPGDWERDSSDDEDVQSASSWGGFPNNKSDTNSNDGDVDMSSRSCPNPSTKQMKQTKSSRVDATANNKKKKKKKKRLKDFFRKSSQDNEPIAEVDEADLITESEGIEGSVSLHQSEHNNTKVADSDSDDIASQSDQNSASHSTYSKGSSKSGKSKGSRKGGRKLSPNRGVSSSRSPRPSRSPKGSPRNSPKGSPRQVKKGKKKDKNKGGLNSSTHSGPSGPVDHPPRQKAVRRGSFGALTRRMSLGGKSDDGDGHFTEDHPKAVRRGSLGGTTEGGGTTVTRRSSIGSMFNAVRRGSLGGNDSGTTQKHKGPVIPEDYHNIIHRERAERGMYLFQRNFILDTIAQGIANDLAAGRAPTPCEFYGNIGKGTSLSVIHSKIMEERKGVSRKNILSQRFKSFGMGLAIGGEKHESIFMCTLFKE